MRCEEPIYTPANAWNGVAMDLTVFKRNSKDCHSNSVYNLNNRPALSAYNSTKFYEHGQEVVFECYDDFAATKKDNFIDHAFDIELELACAKGPKLNSNQLYGKADARTIRDYNGYDGSVDGTSAWDSSIRTETTKELFTFAEQALGMNLVTAVAFGNDKLVARCENGKWLMPSHECKCINQIKREKESCSKVYNARFEGMCESKTSSATGVQPNPATNVNPGMTQDQVNTLIAQQIQQASASMNAQIAEAVKEAVAANAVSKSDVAADVNGVAVGISAGDVGGSNPISTGNADSSAKATTSAGFVLKLGYGLIPIAFVQAINV